MWGVILVPKHVIRSCSFSSTEFIMFCRATGWTGIQAGRQVCQKWKLSSVINPVTAQFTYPLWALVPMASNVGRVPPRAEAGGEDPSQCKRPAGSEHSGNSAGHSYPMERRPNTKPNYPPAQRTPQKLYELFGTIHPMQARFLNSEEQRSCLSVSLNTTAVCFRR